MYKDNSYKMKTTNPKLMARILEAVVKISENDSSENGASTKDILNYVKENNTTGVSKNQTFQV